MALWGKTTNSESRPKFLPVDSNAEGSSGARENCIAQPGGWALSAGTASSGNDNKGAQPEILVCIRGLGTSTLQGANVMSIDWTDGEYADAANFDITVTFDEKVTVTSAALSANQTVTNKAYILLSRVGATDMVQDSTIAAQYLSGSGTNKLVFRGKLQAAAAGFISFSGLGQGAGDDHVAIVLNGTATIVEQGGDNICKLRQESGTAESADDGQGGDGILMDSTAATSVTVAGAISDSTAFTIDGLSGATLVVGMTVTVNGAGGTPAASISDGAGDTGISTDNTLTITAVASQTQFTVSESVTVANDVVLLTSTNGGDDVLTESLEMKFEGVDGETDITGLTRTGGDSEVVMILEDASQETGSDKLVMNGTDGDSANANDDILVEDKTSDIAMFSQVGSASGTANILAGVTTT
jgi:hypothetical protein